MASPTQTEVQNQINRVTDILNNLLQYAGVTALTNFLDTEDTLVQGLETNYGPELLSAVQGFRNQLNGAMESAGSMMTPNFTDMGMVIDCPEKDIQTIFTRLYDQMSDSALAVQTRDITYGAVAAGGANVGTGTIFRLNTDERGFDIENCTPELKKAECVADRFSGASVQEEVFSLLGSDAERDRLKITGSGAVSTIRSMSARDSLVGNASFTSFSGTIAVPTAITNWTPTNIANFEIDQTNFYRTDPADGGNPASLKFKDNDDVEQLWSVRNITLNPAVPYWCSIAYNRQVGGADGTLELTFGDQTVNVVLAAQVGWNLLQIPLGTQNWMRTFNSTTPTLKIELTGRTVGTLLVDDVIFTPFTLFDGLYYQCMGATTPFLLDDSFSWTDTEVGSINQYWFYRTFGRYLPHGTGGAVTWADP